MYSGYAWIRSSVTTSWCSDRLSIATVGLVRCCTLQCLHTVTLRMIPTYFQVCETVLRHAMHVHTFDDGMGLPLETLLGSY